LAGRKHAAAFHEESEITAIDPDEVFGIHDAAMVINQLHESQDSHISLVHEPDDALGRSPA
jgi:hypothetical protein